MRSPEQKATSLRGSERAGDQWEYDTLFQSVVDSICHRIGQFNGFRGEHGNTILDVYSWAESIVRLKKIITRWNETFTNALFTPQDQRRSSTAKELLGRTRGVIAIIPP